MRDRCASTALGLWSTRRESACVKRITSAWSRLLSAAMAEKEALWDGVEHIRSRLGVIRYLIVTTFSHGTSLMKDMERYGLKDWGVHVAVFIGREKRPRAIEGITWIANDYQHKDGVKMMATCMMSALRKELEGRAVILLHDGLYELSRLIEANGASVIAGREWRSVEYALLERIHPGVIECVQEKVPVVVCAEQFMRCATDVLGKMFPADKAEYIARCLCRWRKQWLPSERLSLEQYKLEVDLHWDGTLRRLANAIPIHRDAFFSWLKGGDDSGCAERLHRWLLSLGALQSAPHEET